MFINETTAGEHVNQLTRLSRRSLLARVRCGSVVRNSAYMMATSIVTAGIGYGYWIIAAHLYSPHDIGLASALIGAMMFTADLSAMGIGSTLVQVLPTCEPGEGWSRVVNAGLISGILASGVAAIGVVLILPLLSAEYAVAGHQAGYIIVFVAGVPLWTLSLLLDQTFIAERAADKMLARNAAFAVLKLPLVVAPWLLLHGYGDGLGIFSSWILATGVSVGMGLFALVPRLGKAYRVITRGVVRQGRRMLSSFTWHHLINLGMWVPVYLLPVFVTARLSAADNAYFYVAWMLSQGVAMISRAVATALFAEGSHMPRGIRRKAASGGTIVASLAGPAMLVLLVGGPAILSGFGPSYAQHGSLLLAILVAAAVPGAVVAIYVAVLRVQRRLGLAAALTVGTGILTLTSAWVLTPALGIAGAGFAWLIGQTVGGAIVLADIVASGGYRRTVVCKEERG